MKTLLITTLLLSSWVVLFSQSLIGPQIYLQNLQNRGIKKNSPVSDGHAAINSIDPANFEEFLVSWSEQTHIPGLSVCVLKNGELYWDFHHGLANIEHSIPLTDSSCYLFCSVSKTIVETAIMQLYEKGDFDLFDDINYNLLSPIVNPNFYTMGKP